MDRAAPQYPPHRGGYNPENPVRASLCSCVWKIFYTKGGKGEFGYTFCMRYAKYIFATTWLFISICFGGAITEYKAVFSCFEGKNGGEFALIRTFVDSNRSMGLVVDTKSLKTHIVPLPQSASLHTCKDSRYLEILQHSSDYPYPLQNDGITKGKNGIYLTTDLCPSSKNGYEGRLYRYLPLKLSKPVALTIFVTKRWIEKHLDSMRELERMNIDGNLSIVWGNHTAYHHYHPGMPLRANFVLSPEENLTEDILELETTLIERGDTPSIFFRFPGLVSDRASIETVSGLGLVTIGSDTWLAKGENIHNGSIVLVHGNGNETVGIDILLRLIEKGVVKKVESILNIQPESKKNRESP